MTLSDSTIARLRRFAKVGIWSGVGAIVLWFAGGQLDIAGALFPGGPTDFASSFAADVFLVLYLLVNFASLAGGAILAGGAVAGVLVAAATWNDAARLRTRGRMLTIVGVVIVAFIVLSPFLISLPFPSAIASPLYVATGTAIQLLGPAATALIASGVVALVLAGRGGSIEANADAAAEVAQSDVAS